MLQLSDLESKMWHHLGLEPNDSDMPTASVDLLLNQSWWEIIDKFHFREKEQTGIWSTVAGTALYAVAPTPFEAIRQLSIEDVNDQKHTTIDPATAYEYENLFVNRVDQQDKPQRYVRENSNIRLWPTPDQVYSITMKYWITLSDLASPNNTIPVIPQSWHEIILFGGVWRGFLELGDYARMKEMQEVQKGLIESAVPIEAKEEFDRHRAGLNVLWDSPSKIQQTDTLLPQRGAWNRF